LENHEYSTLWNRLYALEVFENGFCITVKRNLTLINVRKRQLNFKEFQSKKKSLNICGHHFRSNSYQKKNQAWEHLVMKENKTNQH
jgi:hypothetical protein